MGPEGELRVALRVVAQRVQQVQVASTRPDVAQALLQGRSPAEAQAAVPLLFSVCGRSQAAASHLACDAAAGRGASTQALQAAQREVAAETVRETAWLALLHWPRGLGEVPGVQALAAARASAAWGRAVAASADADGAAARQAAAQAVAEAALGMPAAPWLAMDDLAALDRWADAGATAAARWVRRLRDADADDAPRHAGAALLPAEPAPGAMAALAQSLIDDPGFARQPIWQGAPAETGALARRQHDPLVAALARRSAARVAARAVARLRELAALLCEREPPAVAALALAPGRGMAWLENARGLLVHEVQLRQERIVGYRIVAPTEWNFHPAGPVVSALRDTPAADAQARAERLIQSLDPCVACRVEIEDA